MHNFRSGVDTNLVDAGMTLDQATAVTGHTKKVAEEAYLRLQIESKRKAMETLADAYGVSELENGKETKRTHLGAGKRKFQVELTDEDVESVKELVTKAEKQTGKNSGTKSGTSPRRNGKKSKKTQENQKKSAVSAFADCLA